MSTYNMQCPMAAKRLIYSGMPATIEHNVRPGRGATAGAAIAVAETVQHFITAMDSLKLNMAAVDQIYPLLSDLVQAMMKVCGVAWVRLASVACYHCSHVDALLRGAWVPHLAPCHACRSARCRPT